MNRNRARPALGRHPCPSPRTAPVRHRQPAQPAVALPRGQGPAPQALPPGPTADRRRTGQARMTSLCQPEGDHGDVVACKEKSHRGGVAERVHRDVLGSDRRAVGRGGLEVERESVFERVAAESSAGAGREQRIAGSTGAFGKPGFEHHPDGRDERCSPCTPASAHVLLATAQPNGDGTTTLTFTFDHGCGTAPTTELAVSLPSGITAVTTAATIQPPGWSAQATTDQVSWTGPGVTTGHHQAEFAVVTRIVGTVGQTFQFPHRPTLRQRRLLRMDRPPARRRATRTHHGRHQRRPGRTTAVRDSRARGR